MYNHKFLHHYFNGFVNEMISLITNKTGATSKPSYNVFMNEFGYVFVMLSLRALASTHLVMQSMSIVIYWLLILLVIGLVGPIKSKPYFIKGLNAITSLSGPLPFHHIGSNH
jgi:glucan phosphoethanolaminetransferase (alkaline phosphatase superfamily)